MSRRKGNDRTKSAAQARSTPAPEQHTQSTGGVALLRKLVGRVPGTLAHDMLDQLLGHSWLTLTDTDLRERLIDLPLRHVTRLATCLDIDHTDLVDHLLRQPTPGHDPTDTDHGGQHKEQAAQHDDAWELHGLLLHVGSVGARHAEVAEALGWSLQRLVDAARVLNGLLTPHPRYELAYHFDGRLHLRATGHRLSHRARAHIPGDPARRLPINAEHAALLLATDHLHPLPDELPRHLVQRLIDAGHAIVHTDYTLVLSPDVDLATSVQPLPPPEDGAGRS